MTKQERTPGPWRWEWSQREETFELLAPTDPNHKGVKFVIGDVVSDDDAAHIVHCVNTYDELVGALEALVIFDEGALESKRPDIFARQMNRAIAALKLAKGGNGE